MEWKKLYVVRHGQTDYNKFRKVQGSGIDAPLNALGMAQAEAFFEAYRDYPFEQIFISNLIRTYQSVKPFIDLGLPYEKLEGLNEISWGEKEGQSFSEEAHEEYLRFTKAWQNGNTHYAIKGGESPETVKKRQQEAMKTILASPAKYILVCMHGRAMRILLTWLLGYELKYMDMFEHHNLGMYELTYTGKMFRVDRMNETGHLQALMAKATAEHNLSA